ncbi:MAG: signal recognition particle-docking protein FtsY [Myxococcota bacterium]|nr:signal recognition particle-docking protein FtsY [Myxococcota bacterium]
MDPALIGGVTGAVVAIVVAVVLSLRARNSKQLTDGDLEPSDSSTPASTSEVTPAPTGPSVLDRFRAGLARTTDSLGLARIFGQKVDESLFEDLETALISADVGIKTTTAVLDTLRKTAREQKIQDGDTLRLALIDQLKASAARFDPSLNASPAGEPHVILVVGVNGAGKTTTIGKLSHRFKEEGKKVVLGAGDTFRAGAIQQLQAWGERTGVEVIAHQEGGDPAAVLFDTLKAAKARGADVVICDTAGRLQSKKPLMQELGKVTRVVAKAQPGAPHEVLLVLDGTMGQNALSQAKTFTEVTGVTGLVVTKLDGTAKGGVVLAVQEQTGLPIKFIGIGEGTLDLRPFDGDAFIEALLS